MKGFLFIVSIPHERGIVYYDTQSMLMLLPKGYQVIERDPEMSVLATEILFTWKCKEIRDQDPIEYKAGVIGNNPHNNRL